MLEDKRRWMSNEVARISDLTRGGQVARHPQRLGAFWFQPRFRAYSIRGISTAVVNPASLVPQIFAVQGIECSDPAQQVEDLQTVQIKESAPPISVNAA